MALKLYTSPGNKNAFKALIAADYVGVRIEVPPFQWGVTNKSPEFLKLNPIGKIPVLQTPHGAVFESNAIARYIARLSDKGLYGTTLLDMAQVEQWIDFSTNELDTHLGRWGNPLHGYGTRIKEVEEKAIASARRALTALDTYLADSTYLVGHQVTLADIVTVCNLYIPFQGLLSAEYMKEFPHVQRYFFTLVNQPSFAKVIGEVKQCESTPTDVLPADKRVGPPPSTAKAAPPAAAPAPAPAPAEPKPKAEKKVEKKKAEKPKEVAAPSAAADDEEDEPAPKPKAKSPLDTLPPSKLVMDEWKRKYSNTKAAEFREVAISWFWEQYDPEGYSLWFCDYKYNDENQVKFVTLNKVSGFLQRMDVIRKHGFAKMCILGDDPPYVIKGVWMFRGAEVPQVVKDECYDVELYEWTKVDISDEKQKELVSDYYEEPDKIGGLTLVEAKCFK